MYRYTRPALEEMDRQVARLLKLGHIQPSKSDWSASVVLAPKKDGTWRFAIDYRGLNRLTKGDAYPIPRTDVSMEQLTGCKYVTKLDMFTGYWQIPMKEGDREKTAFSSRTGLMEWLDMPMGLKNSGSTFQRTMVRVLGDLVNVCVIIYIDDVFVYSRTFEQHLKDLDQVLGRLQGVDLTCKLKKCEFAERELECLGHMVSGQTIRPVDRIVKKVSKCEPPVDHLGVQSFLGLVGYYRRFIPDYAKIALPLNEVQGTKTAFKWGVTG